MFRFVPAVLTAILVAFPGLAQAAKVKFWHHANPGHYDKARFTGAVVSSAGALRLSRQLKPFASLDATHVWDIIEDKQGNLFVATGDDGKLYKVTPEGKVSIAWEAEDSQILCLALAPDGVIYAGTGPGGQLVRIKPDGKIKVIYRCPDAYIWCLALDPAGESIYAGTGPKGRIYQVTPQGKATVFFTTKQEHILCLTMGPNNTLYAGTDKNGLVYRFEGQGKGFVLYHAPQAEVRSLLIGPDGIYAGTCSPRRRGGGDNQASKGAAPPSRLAATLVSSTKASTKTATGKGDSSSTTPGKDKEDKEEKSSPAPAPTPPSSGENSLYRISADGTVREVFREKAMILSLLRQNGRIFVGTGMEGQLFEVNERTRERSEIARLDHGQIHCMCRRRDGSILLGTGDPGKLYLLQDKYTLKGTVVSEVLDAKLISKWGALRWQADRPAGTSVSVAVRSGNLPEPDETWSDWSAEQTDPEGIMSTTPPARYLQYRVTLATEDPAVTPAVRSVVLRYMTMNQAPEITGIEVPDLDAVNLDNPKKLKFKWTATDPNEDDLAYSLYVRKDGWKSWVQLEDNLEKREYEWDTTTTPEGVYRLKVMASDRKDNPAEDALTAARTSAPFTVAHTPPVVTLKVADLDGDQVVIEAKAVAPLVRLTAASFAVNGKKWVNVFPTDGLFDSKTETFRFKTESLKPGTYVLVLRVRDAAGNTGSGDVVFTVPAQK
jgi:hypothetical protein